MQVIKNTLGLFQKQMYEFFKCNTGEIWWTMIEQATKPHLVQTYTWEHIGCRILPGSALGCFKVYTICAPECHGCVRGYHNSSEIHILLTLMGAFTAMTAWSLWDSQHTSSIQQDARSERHSNKQTSKTNSSYFYPKIARRWIPTSFS